MRVTVLSAARITAAEGKEQDEQTQDGEGMDVQGGKQEHGDESEDEDDQVKHNHLFPYHETRFPVRGGLISVVYIASACTGREGRVDDD